jgi:hypothetical protein
LGAEAHGLNYQLQVQMSQEIAGMTAELSAGEVVCTTSCMTTFDLALTLDGSTLVDGAYEGVVVATGQNTTLRLPFAVEVAKTASTLPKDPRREHPAMKVIGPLRMVDR